MSMADFGCVGSFGVSSNRLDVLLMVEHVFVMVAAIEDAYAGC